MKNRQPIGFCQYYDCYDASEDWYSIQALGEIYSIYYLRGEETQAKEIIVQQEEEKLSSCKTLISCGCQYNKTVAFYQMN